MSTTLKLGWSDPLTGAFMDHPVLGPVFDLDDGVTFTLASPDGLALQPPPRTVVTAGNIRTRGERATRAIYRHNREVIARVLVGPMASYADLVANIRSLVAWLDAPPAVPFTIEYQPNSATQPVYLDVVACAHSIPEDEGDWLRLQFEPVELVFVCRPGLRGDRITLQNLVVNPGFEAPSGPGVVVFNDAFSNTSAYTVQAGGSPTTGPANTYVDVLFANLPAGGSLLRYYRLDEPSGTVANDVSGQGQNGTVSATGITYGVAGLLAGDTDACMTFSSASSGKITGPVTGMPTGNSPFSAHCWFKLAANPAANAVLLYYGGTTSKQGFSVYVDTTGKLNADVLAGTGTITSAAAVSLNVAHHACVTWDGTTYTLYLDGVSVGTSAPGALSVTASNLVVGDNTGTNFWNGQMDEPCFYSGSLSSAQVGALYSAGHSGATGTLASSMSVPAAARVSFGTSGWGAINTWQVRFRWNAAASEFDFYLHYTDANDALFVFVKPTQLALAHTVGGVFHQLATAAPTMTHEAWYWLQITQYPSPGNPDPACVQANLYNDAAGAVGSLVASVGPVGTFDAVTALVGAPEIAAVGGSLVLGGPYASVHSLSLFGPGGWQFASAGSVPALGVWDGSLPERGSLGSGAANMYAGGPVASYGAARIDTPASGTVDARWRLFSGGAPLGSWAMPVASAGNVLGVSAWVRSSGLGASAQIQAIVSEFDASGNLLRSGTVATLNGSQAAWTQLSGTYTTGASCAYADLALRVVDTVAGDSPNASVWFENAQCWNVSTTGLASMPWCQLRMPQSPCELVVSGLLGDLPAPTLLSFGTLVASWPAGGTLGFAIGRKGSVNPTARLVGPPVGWYGTALSPTSAGVLDSGSLGGFFIQATLAGSGYQPRFVSVTAADDSGIYHLMSRFLSKEPVGSIPNISTRVGVQQRSQPWYGDIVGFLDQVGNYFGPSVSPLTQSSVWTVVDAGQVAIPFAPNGALTDPSQLFFTPRCQWSDSTAGGATAQAGWCMLLPIDGSLVVGVLNNPSNAVGAISNQWVWGYLDGLLVNRAGASDGPSWLYSLEGGPSPNPARGGGGVGTQNTGTVNINSGADPYLTLDPTLQVSGQGAGVNQFAAYVADQAGAVLPFMGELSYSPLYLYPR